MLPRCYMNGRGIVTEAVLFVGGHIDSSAFGSLWSGLDQGQASSKRILSCGSQIDGDPQWEGMREAYIVSGISPSPPSIKSRTNGMASRTTSTRAMSMPGLGRAEMRGK